MRRHDEPVQVLFDDAPRQFIWRRRLLKVVAVQGHWRHSVPWWRRPEPEPLDLTMEREVWRVEAGNGIVRGVYELARTAGEQDWVLQGLWD